MKTNIYRILVLLLLFVFNFLNSYSEVVTYSSPGDLSAVPHLKQSADYTVKVNGLTSFVYETDNYWDGGGNPAIIRFEKKAAFTNFDFKNETVTVEVTCNFTVNTVTIRPKNDNVAFTKIGNTISFTLSKSTYLSVEVNDRLKPLFIFADSLETPPVANITFGPGIWNVGNKYVLPANQTVYIAGGAVVNGTFASKGSNLKIMGRGILNCGGVTWDEWLLDKLLSPLSAVGGSLTAYELNGFTMLNAPGWHINAYGGDNKFLNLKCIAWAGNTDGPHLNGNGIMQHCFVFNNDDALITNRGDNNTFRDCVVWKGNWGHCMISLADNSQNTQLWEDIDVIGDQAKLSFKVGKTFSIETALNNATVPATAVKQNYIFRNIRIEGQMPDEAGLVYMCAEGTAKIKNITFENVTSGMLRTAAVNSEGTMEIKDSGSIDGVHFKCIKMNGTLVNSLAQAHIQTVGSVLNVDFNNTCSLTTIEEVYEKNKLNISTNNHKLHLEFGDIKFENVSLYNCMGSNVKTGKVAELDISNLPVGIYLVQAEANGNHYFGKFLKQ